MARRRFSGGKKIHAVRWGGAVSRFGAQAAGSAALTWITAGTLQSTLMRVRGNLAAWIDGTPVPGTEVGVTFGLIVMPEGQSTTVVSEPFVDDDAPWLYYTTFTLAYEEPVIDVVSQPWMTSFREVIDNKAMRILRPAREVQAVMTNTTQGTAGAVNLVFSARGLIGEN